MHVCLFQRVSVDGSTCRSRDEESNMSVLLSHGVSSRQFVDMCLPSFRPTYLFLARIPLDIIHECLKLRLEQRPDKDPSLLSLQSVSHTFVSVIALLLASRTGGRHNMPPPPVTLTFDLESGVRVTCDVGYLCAKFSRPRPLCSRLRPDVHDKQTSDRRQTASSLNVPSAGA